MISIFHLFGIIGVVVVVVAGITITEAVLVLCTDRPILYYEHQAAHVSIWHYPKFGADPNKICMFAFNMDTR